jgi:four helix bundle protein
MHRYKDLMAWKLSMKIVKEVYLMTEKFPKQEQFGLTNQIRRSAVSIPSNIAEGAGKNSDSDFSRFLAIAMGSCNELETQLQISCELGFIERNEYELTENRTSRVQNMLFKLQKRLRNT